MIRKQRLKLLTFVLISVLLAGSFGAAASAAETGAVVSGESFDVSGNGSKEDDPAPEKEQEETVEEQSDEGNGQENSDADNTQEPSDDANSGEENEQQNPSIGESGRENEQSVTTEETPASIEGEPQESELPEGETEPEEGKISESGVTSEDGTTPETDTTSEDGATPETGAVSEDGTATDQNGEGTDASAEDAVEPGTVITEDASGASTQKKVEEASVQMLGTPQNVIWKETTTLSWDAVKNAGRYRVTVWLQKGAQRYSKVVFVSGRNSYDVEDEIVSLIKSNRKYLTGAAYTISAAVQAQTTDTAHYSNGKAAASPSFRYLRTTYLEAIERNGWFLRNNNWYYYENGVMKTGWLSFGGERYFLNKDGVMLKNRWYSGCYLKSSGAMAKNEWVDNYQYYVGSNGKVVENTAFSTRNWVQTKAGWRYKKTTTTYVKSAWVSANHRMYYFDAAGHMVTGWLTLDGKKYYLKTDGDLSSGLGARQSGWVRIGSYYYWFDKDGVLATSQWVDKGQYYVNASGKRLNWVSYAELRNVSTSNRLGYNIYSSASPPEQSIAAYDLAYQNGNRILVIDLRFTKDNIPVCFHDDVVKYARNENGKEPAKKATVSTMTYAELCKYDYGIYRGTKYKGTGPLTLSMMAGWIKRHSDAELYIEVKAETMNIVQIRNLAEIIKTNGITDQCSTIFTVKSTSDTRASRVHKLLPEMRIGITTSSVGSLSYTMLDQVKGNNETFLWQWNTTALNATSVNTLRNKDVPYECGIFTNEIDSVLSYYAKGSSYSYNSGVETPGAVFKTLLSAATFHDKAQWVSTDKGWMYQKVDKTFVKNSWLTLSGKKYYLNANGIRQTGWLNRSGNLYYLNSDGTMATGWKTIASKKYYFGDDGVMRTGWQVVNGRKILFDSKGVFVKKV